MTITVFNQLESAIVYNIQDAEQEMADATKRLIIFNERLCEQNKLLAQIVDAETAVNDAIQQTRECLKKIRALAIKAEAEAVFWQAIEALKNQANTAPDPLASANIASTGDRLLSFSEYKDLSWDEISNMEFRLDSDSPATEEQSSSAIAQSSDLTTEIMTDLGIDS